MIRTYIGTPKYYKTRQRRRSNPGSSCAGLTEQGLTDRSIIVLRKRRHRHAGHTVHEYPLCLPHVKLFVHVVQGRCYLCTVHGYCSLMLGVRCSADGHVRRGKPDTIRVRFRFRP